MVEESVVTEGTEGEPRTYTKLIIFLLVVVLGLLYLYYVLSKPLQPLVTPRLKGYTHVLSIYGAGADRLYRPTEVAVGKDGKIFVADTMKHRIMVFDRNGRFLTKFGKKGKGKGEIEFPSAITVDDNGRVYVISYNLSKLIIYNQRYKPYWEITFPGLGPLSATVKGKRLYITTRAGIMIGDLKGNLLTTLSRGGSRKGEVNRPTGIAVDNRGNIYLADSMNYRIEALDKKGKPLWVVGAPPKTGPGKPLEEVERTRQFGLPVSLTLGPDGNLYVMDAFAGEILILDKKGKILGKVGDWGQEDGQFYYPAGITSAGGDRFVVADKFNDRVQVVRIPSPTAGAVLPFAQWAFNPYVIALLILAIITVLTWMWYRRWKRQRAQEESA